MKFAIQPIKFGISLAASALSLSALSLSAQSFELEPPFDTDSTPTVNDESGVIFLEPDLYKIMSDWRGDDQMTYRETLVEGGRTDLITEFIAQLEREEGYQSLTEFLMNKDVELLTTLKGDYTELQPRETLDVFMFARLIETDHPILNAWQFVVQEGVATGDVKLFSDFAAEVDPASFEDWFFNREIPSDSLSLGEFAEANYPERAGELMDQVRRFRPWKPKGGTGGGSGGGSTQCDCTVIASYLNNPSGYVNHHSQWQNRNNNPTKVNEKWMEGFYAAHYAESYVLGKGRENFTEESDARQINRTSIQFMIDCQDEDSRDCAGCSADMDIYAIYGSKLQVHNDQWGFFGGASEAAAKDKVKMDIYLNNGGFQAFEKAVALSQSNKSSIRMDKVQSFIGHLGTAYEKIEKNANNQVINQNDFAEYAKIANNLVKDAKAMVEVTGKKGVTSETMHVEYNTNSQSTAPTHRISENKNYALTMESEGALVYKGKNYHKTNNSYYGSSAGLAFALSGVQCTANVTTPIKEKGCWSHADTYRSPHHGTTTLKDNIKQFVQFNLGTSGVDTSSHNGCYSN